MKNTIRAIAVLAFVVALGSVCFAQTTSTIPVKAVINASTGLSVSIWRITGSTWAEDSEINFGTLTLDPTYQIFRSASYYALEVAVNSNATNWTLRHTANSVASGTNNLNSNINVTFVRQIDDTTSADLTGGKVSYANSNAKQYTKADFALGGWMRIYYGLATGSGDNSGVSVITSSKAAGNYAGSVVLTLTTS